MAAPVVAAAAVSAAAMLFQQLMQQRAEKEAVKRAREEEERQRKFQIEQAGMNRLQTAQRDQLQNVQNQGPAERDALSQLIAALGATRR